MSISQEKPQTLYFIINNKGCYAGYGPGLSSANMFTVVSSRKGWVFFHFLGHQSTSIYFHICGWTRGSPNGDNENTSKESLTSQAPAPYWKVTVLGWGSRRQAGRWRACCGVSSSCCVCSDNRSSPFTGLDTRFLSGVLAGPTDSSPNTESFLLDFTLAFHQSTFEPLANKFFRGGLEFYLVGAWWRERKM